MSKSFLEAARQGKNHWWHYVAMILTIEIFWWGFSGYVVGMGQAIASWVFTSPYINFFVATSIPFIFLLAFLIFTVKKIHYRKFFSLINTDASIDFQRLFLGFGIWGLQLFIFTAIDLLLRPQDYFNSFDPGQWFCLFFLVLILTPIQTSAEEFFYRGYLMQGLGLVTKHPFVLIVVTSVAFAVPHFANPEMQRGFVWGALTYFIWGIFFAAITLKDNGLELALGVHAANNIFSFLIVNTPDSVVPTPAIWTFIRSLDAKEVFFSLLIQAIIFYAIFFGGVARKSQSP